MAVMFRQSMLLNGFLCNSEVLYGMTKSHIETLESVDKYLWRNVFKCPFSTPTEAFFIETDTIPIRFVIMKRRLMYYWNILHMGENELVRKVFNIQKVDSCRNDWVIQINEELEMCNIVQSEEELRTMKKYSFRRLVNKKVKEAATRYLMSLKEKHTKCDDIEPASGMKEYLKC